MSPDLAAQLRAVLDEPEADQPRLAYAARLAESSRIADQARAEFIRLQIEVSRLTDADLRWPKLVGRERDLLDEHRAAWEKPLRDRLRPSLASPGRWLRSHLFGCGGHWSFRRGFVEHVLAAAPTFLSEDAAILDHAPIRRVMLTHASGHVREFAADPRLDRLASLHLVGDMELDEDLGNLADCARQAGLTVLEFRLPRLWEELDELGSALRSSNWSDDLDRFPAWRHADAKARRRLQEFATSRWPSIFDRNPADEGEVLARTEWVYLGKEASAAGVWAVAKAHQDLKDEEGRCRRLLLLRPGRGDELRESPYLWQR
jgi:uncharacterized protein (TIGR02996 family)